MVEGATLNPQRLLMNGWYELAYPGCRLWKDPRDSLAGVRNTVLYIGKPGAGLSLLGARRRR
jgi:hypothetical protein